MDSINNLYEVFLNCHATVTTDSRNCPNGALFFGLKGELFDGNTYAAQALANGCSYAVIDNINYLPEGDQRFILVENSLHALQELANYHRNRLGTTIIAITGTNGKTTTKELIAAVLSKSYKIGYTQGNFNNHIGVPLTLLKLQPDQPIAVIEMGANHEGEIKTLCQIANPTCGMITNVGKAHLEGFGSFEGVKRTKGELYDYLRQRGLTAFMNHDDPHLMKMGEDLNQVLYGCEGNLFVNGRIEGCSPYLTMDWKIGSEGEVHHVQTHLVGEYNFFNVLAAVTIGHYFKVTEKDINDALCEYMPQNNRSQLKETADNTLIIDAYNANPTSMMAALSNFRNMEVEHKMLLLGDMRELGEDSKEEHQKIVDYISQGGFEQVWLVGEQFASTQHHFQTFANVQKVIDELANTKPKGFTILIKGSNGIKLSSVVDYL